MDIHRCRFVPYPPSTINALAFSHSSAPKSKSKGFPTLRLAIGRSNGDIEIWNPLKGIWFQECIFRSGKDRTIEGLVWTQDPDEVDKDGQHLAGRLRLFSIGYSAAVTEWDLALGRPSRHCAGNHEDLWCIAAQPKSELSEDAEAESHIARSQSSSFNAQHIIAGCANGAIILLSTSDGDLRFLRTLARPPKKKARVLSVTFQNQNVVVAGHADSTIRVFDIRNRQQLRNISLGAGPAGGPKEILVWAVRCLADGTIVSGDSTGTVRFWDAKLHTLSQRIQSHTADILDIVASADGETVMSCGMDRRTIFYRRVGSGKKGDKYHWAELAHQRNHKHDVKAMATFETKNLSVMASGGLDTKPIITPIREFGRENHRSLPSFPQQPSIGGASNERLMMSWWGNEIGIWRLPFHDHPYVDMVEEGKSFEEPQTQKLVAKILVQGDEALTSVDLSSEGTMLVAGTISSVKVFHLRCKNINTLKVSKLQVPISIGGSGARTAKFSPDGKWLLLIRPDSNLHIYRLTWDGGPKIRPSLRPKATILKRLFRDQAKEQVRCGSLGNYERSIHRVAFSADSKILAVGDLSGYIDSWILEGHEDLTHDNDEAMVVKSPKSSDEESADEEIHPNVILGQSWIRNPAASHLARLETAPLVLSFRPPRPKVDSKGGSNDKFVHSTRNTPYPCSHDLPNDDRLFTITGNHRMYEFTIRTGRLSEWSRRNFSPSLPSSFRDIMDRAMGLIWDISMQKERVWIYGTSWLWMFDLSKDFSNRALNEYKNAVDELSSIPNGTNKRKRKRKPTDEGPEEVRKRTSGAGGQKTSAKLDIGIGRKFRKIDGPDLASSRWINADAEQSQASDDDNYDDDDDDDDDDVATQPAVNNSRRKSGGKAQLYDNFTGDIASSDSEARLDGHNPQTDLPYWGTHRYRDILGIVPLMDRHEHVDKLPRRVEVALVERLILEVDLPPKYHSNQERND